MKRNVYVMIGLALAASALALSAQPGPGCGAGAQHRYGAQQSPPCMNLFDADANGVLSADEMAQAAAALRKLDRNQDGQITQDETCPAGLGRAAQCNGQGGQGRGRGAGKGAAGQKAGLLARFDTSADGILSAPEIDNAPAILRAMDKNNDGQLTGDEMRLGGGFGNGACRRNQV